MEKDILDYKIIFIDVGQGDATLILQTATNNAILVDVGQFEPLLPSLNNEISFESIFISHFHDDHIGGLSELIEWMRKRNKSSTLRINKQNLNNKTSKRLAACIHEAYKDCVLSIESAHSDPNKNKIDLIDGCISVLWPPYAQFFDGQDKKNHDCQILKFEAGLFKLLLGGDAPGAVWAKLLPKAIKANILKFPHHGGRLKTKKDDWDSYDLIVAVDPEITVVSLGNQNRYGHPAKEFRDAIEKLPEKTFYFTAKEGNVQFQVNGCSGSLCRL